MGFFKAFDLPKKEPESGLNTADRSYLIKLIVVTGVFTASLSIFGTMLLFERHINRMDNSTQILTEWSKKADLANDMLDDMFKVQRIKKSYEKQGIKVDEAIINKQ